MVITEVIYSEISNAISPHNDSLLMVRILYIINSKSWAGFGEQSPINTKRKYIAKNIKVCIMFLRVSKL